MSKATPADTQGVNPIIEVFRPQKLQNLQANEIQAIIMILKYLVATYTKPTKPEPLQSQAHQEPITKE